jgi:CRISPR-associated protein Csx14
VSQDQPIITLNTVDLTNPGQFFACCGLLELAHRLTPGAEVTGGFSASRFDRARFCILSKAVFTLEDLLKKLLQCERKSVDPYRPIMGSNGKPVADVKKTKPILLGEPVSLRLNWWLDELAGKQTAFKLWGAHLTSERLLGDMVNAVSPEALSESGVLQSRVGMTSRIGLDTRSSWNTLDQGFSPNDQTLPVDTYPLAELLGAVGLQTFRPAPVDRGYAYMCWWTPMPTVVARAVASGSVRIEGTTCYRFEVQARGKFKFFSKAMPYERDNND